MLYKLIIKEEARLEISDAYLYYEEQQIGLGERFLSEIAKRFDDLITHPEYYSFIDDRKILRDITISTFPYILIYRITGDEVRIHAVLHTSRNSPQQLD